MFFYLLVDGNWRNASNPEESLQFSKPPMTESISDAVFTVKRSIVSSG
jgi:hypothetical protein